MIKWLYWDDLGAIDRIEQALRAGKAVLGSSDTVFGLLAMPCQSGLRELDQIKQRADKPYLVLIGQKDKAELFVNQQDIFQIENIINVCWPGPLTLILRAKAGVAQYMQSKDGTIALRVPNHTGLQQLLSRFDGLFSTSANRTGQPIPSTLDEIDKEILQQAACVVIDRMRPEHIQKEVRPSTILDCSGDEIKVIREGAYPVDQLEKIYGKPF